MSTMNVEISQLLCDLADILQAEDASLFLIRNSHPHAPLDLAAVGRRAVLDELAIPHGEGIAGWVVIHGEPVVSNNPEKDGRFLKIIDMLLKIQTRSLLAVPVSYSNKIIGVIEVINKAGNAKFIESDIAKAAQTAEAILPYISKEKI